MGGDRPVTVVAQADSVVKWKADSEGRIRINRKGMFTPGEWYKIIHIAETEEGSVPLDRLVQMITGQVLASLTAQGLKVDITPVEEEDGQ